MAAKSRSSEEKIFLTVANQKKKIALGGHVCWPNGTI
jgi:hypothetical protein